MRSPYQDELSPSVFWFLRENFYFVKFRLATDAASLSPRPRNTSRPTTSPSPQPWPPDPPHVNANWGLDSQTLATLAAAASNDGPTCRCPHASSKTVFVASFSIAWLEGSLHESLPRVGACRQSGARKAETPKLQAVRTSVNSHHRCQRRHLSASKLGITGANLDVLCSNS